MGFAGEDCDGGGDFGDAGVQVAPGDRWWCVKAWAMG
jgi:hypothetical protein